MRLGKVPEAESALNPDNMGYRVRALTLKPVSCQLQGGVLLQPACMAHASMHCRAAACA